MDLNVLVEAKNEYYDQIVEAMCPSMIESFQKLYKDATKLSKGKKVLLQFQVLLQDVPNWNPKMVDDHVKEITNSCSWFNDLMAAAFVSYVKILSSVRLNNTDKKVSIKLPSNELFVQGVYNLAAEDIYNDPYMFGEVMTDRERMAALRTRFRDCIDTNIRKLAPIQEILKTYMTSTNDTPELDFNVNNTEEDQEDPDISDGPMEEEEDEEGEGEFDPTEAAAVINDDPNEGGDPTEAMGEPVDSLLPPMDPMDPMAPEAPLAPAVPAALAVPIEETKNVQVGKFKDDVLFPDAPDA